MLASPRKSAAALLRRKGQARPRRAAHESATGPKVPAARYIQSNPPRAKGGWSPYVVTIDQDEPTRVALVPPSRGGGQHDDGRVYLRAIVLFAEAALLLSSKATHDPLEGGELMGGWGQS